MKYVVMVLLLLFFSVKADAQQNCQTVPIKLTAIAKKTTYIPKIIVPLCADYKEYSTKEFVGLKSFYWIAKEDQSFVESLITSSQK